MKLKPIMFVGTHSDAGKSVINAGFCRIFKQDGYSPAPYKAQNMSLNSYSTPDGLEIGRAQAVQAEACGLEAHTDMNPVLLKPSCDIVAQVIVNGKPIGNLSARDFFIDTDRAKLFDTAYKAFQRLEERYSPIVLEGAGSISEINLRDKDITNMNMAVKTNASTYLIADIDKGGVFGSVYGSVMLLTPEERACLKGIIINKFRGDISLFEKGRQILEELTGIPVVAIIPWYEDIYIEEEDSVILDYKNQKSTEGKINVAVVLLKHMSNFTDFKALELDERFHLYYTQDKKEINKADIIVIPGSKNTINDLNYLREKGIDRTIIDAYNKGKKVIGICGGYQMMGKEIRDPYCVESDISVTEGLGLFPQITTLEKEKVIRQTEFRYRDYPDICRGYEIHMGKTYMAKEEQQNHLNITFEGEYDGYTDNNAAGTYIHGIFDNAAVLDDIASEFGVNNKNSFDYNKFKEEQYDKLAAHIRKYTDMEYIYNTLL